MVGACNISMAVATTAFAMMIGTASGAPRCTAETRDCMSRAALSYYDGIVNHDGARVWLSPDLRHTLQAGKVRSEAEVRKLLDSEPAMRPYRDARVWVDEPAHTVFVLTLLPVIKGKEGQPATVHAVGRFRVEKGLITEYEGLFSTEQGTADGTSKWETVSAPQERAEAPATARPECGVATRDCMIRAAVSYYDAITNHDGSRALLSPRLRHTLQAGKVRGEAEVRKLLDGEPPMLPHRDTRFWVDLHDHTVLVLTLLPVTRLGDPGAPATVHAFGRFKIDHGLITEYEGIFMTRNGTADDTSKWERIATAAGTAAPQAK